MNTYSKYIEPYVLYSEQSTVFHKFFNDAMKVYDFKRCLKQIKTYSDELFEHSLKVAFLSVLIAQDKKNIDGTKLLMAAALHDYGKIHIAPNVLFKSDTLTKREKMTIRQHTGIGYAYLSNITSFTDDILSGILEHHERLNGTGYYKIVNENICMFAKIIAVADVFDAMVSNRVYRKGMEIKEVLKYLSANKGILFHIESVDILLNKMHSLVDKYNS